MLIRDSSGHFIDFCTYTHTILQMDTVTKSLIIMKSFRKLPYIHTATIMFSYFASEQLKHFGTNEQKKKSLRMFFLCYSTINVCQITLGHYTQSAINYITTENKSVAINYITTENKSAINYITTENKPNCLMMIKTLLMSLSDQYLKV